MRRSEPYDHRAASPPLSRLVERAYSATAASGPASAFWEREALRARREAPPPRISPESLPPPAPPQVLTPPPPPLYQQLLEFIQSMWRASGSAVEVALEVNKTTLAERIAQQARDDEPLTYSDPKVKRTGGS